MLDVVCTIAIDIEQCWPEVNATLFLNTSNAIVEITRSHTAFEKKHKRRLRAAELGRTTLLAACQVPQPRRRAFGDEESACVNPRLKTPHWMRLEAVRCRARP